MSPPAIGTSLDERGPFAWARPRNRLANDPPYGVDVIAVDQRAGHAKRFGAAPDIASVHRLIRGELRKSVILADQQQWKLPQGGDVQRLGNDALAGRTVTEKHHGNPALAVKLRAECRTDREPYATADNAVGAQYALRDVGNMHRAALAVANAGLFSHELPRPSARLSALRQEVTEPAQSAGNPVPGAKMCAAPSDPLFLANIKLLISRTVAGSPEATEPSPHND